MLRRYLRAVLRASGVCVDGLSWQSALDVLAAVSLYCKGNLPDFGRWASVRLPQTAESVEREEKAALAQMRSLMKG